MNFSIKDLKCASDSHWLEAVMADFSSFLQDHADCERKASAMALSFVAKYPDRAEIIPRLLDTAVEELQHFRQVYKLMEKRGILLAKEIQKDPYVTQLLDLCRPSPTDRFLDRLVLASIIEWRGCERFRLVAEELEEEELRQFYTLLYESEARHGESFGEMALLYFPEEEVNPRYQEILEKEAEILQSLAYRAALH